MDIKAARLTDPVLEKQLQQDGLVVLKEWLSQDEIAAIRQMYENAHPLKDPTRTNMWNSLYDIEPHAALLASQQILAILKPRLDELFSAYNAPVAVMMAKNMGDDSTCHLHRDTSILDEAKYEYRNLWIPLTDTTERNGALYFVRGSHRFLTYPRPPALSWHYDYLERDLMTHKETLHSRGGDCVIFLDKTLHGSHQNLSTEYRPVIFFGVLHPDAETLYYYYDAQKKEMRAYAVGPDFYFRKDFSEPVGLPLRLTLPYDPPHIVPADMLSILESQAAH